MSLFGSREWWAVRIGDREEFDQRSLCVANIDNEPSGDGAVLHRGAAVRPPRTPQNRRTQCLPRPKAKPPTGRDPRAVKLITGSLQGMLRVHQPRGREHKAEDCLLEAQLEAGILQLEAGRFAGCGAGRRGARNVQPGSLTQRSKP
jgi:hypothetical protein